MKYGYFISLIIIVIFSSCKKNRPTTLEGEYAIAVAEWHWIYTIQKYEFCFSGTGENDTLTPVTESMTNSIQILEKGRINFITNNEIVYSEKVQLDYFNNTFCGEPEDSTIYVHFITAKEKELVLGGCIFGDTLRASTWNDFPLMDHSDCHEYSVYFVKD